MGLVEQALLAFRAVCFGGLISLLGVLKVGVLDMWFKSFTPQEEAGS